MEALQKHIDRIRQIAEHLVLLSNLLEYRHLPFKGRETIAERIAHFSDLDEAYRQVFDAIIKDHGHEPFKRKS